MIQTHIDNEKPKPIIGQPWSGAHLSIQSHSRKPESSSASTTTINTSSEVLTSNALYSNKYHSLGANNCNDYVTYANPVTSTASHTTTTTTTVTATTTSVTTATTASYQKANPHAPKNNNYVSNTTTTTTSAAVGSHSIPIPARSSSRTSTTTTHAASATTTASAPHNNVNKYVGSFSSSSSSSNYSNVRQSHVKTSTSITTTTSSSSNNNSGSSSSSVSGAYHRKNLSDVPAMVASDNNAKNEEANILAGKKNEPNAKPIRQHVTDKVKETPVMNNSLTVSNKESKIMPNASISVKEPQIRNAVANAPAVNIKEPQVRNAVATTAASVSTAAARSPIKLKISGSSLSFSNSLKPPAASSHNDLNSSLQRHPSVATIASTLPPPPPPPQASSSTFTANQSSQEKEPIKIKLNLKAVNQVEERRPPEESNGMKVVLSKSKDGSYIQQSQLQNAGQSARPSANSYINDPLPPVLSLPPPPVQQQHHGHHHKKRKAEHSSSSSSHSSHHRKHLKLDKTSQEQDSNQQPMPQPHHQQQQQRHQPQQPQPRVNIQNNFNAYMSSLPFRK
ncbi:hypothetical protein HELRODRAFT_193718 [Helobdella robusta]|uniref:Uncharacterized protein n=1 Tax=Helobdella robusta TaxID=6412 RepID=T1FVA4_HELRO|nr:hypothetical protein HELRODRAFT_193718 [Helobdella robusta]ESN95024.1 hypothetical protein HELRODRAFT_193718 [Helobdella robusta]